MILEVDVRTLGILAACLTLMGSIPTAQADPIEKVEISTASGVHQFDVEVMRTEPERERGLMFRKTMEPTHGMLFDFQAPQPIFMWMKNTLLPLDMVFIDAQGAVVNVVEDAVPMSEKVIASGQPVLGVLEINAGTARTIQLKRGDRVTNPMFKR